MKKKIVVIVVSVMMLLCLTVNAMAAVKVGTTEWDKPTGCQTRKKVVVSSAYNPQPKQLRQVTQDAYFDGNHPLHICYSQSGSGTYSVNGSVAVEIKGIVNVSTSIGYSWTAGEAASHTYDVNKGDKVGYYSIRYMLNLYSHSYKYYTRTSNIFSTGDWKLQSSGTILDKVNNKPYFKLVYHQ